MRRAFRCPAEAGAVKTVSPDSLFQPMVRPGVCRCGFCKCPVERGIKNSRLRRLFAKNFSSDTNTSQVVRIVQWREGGTAIDYCFDIFCDLYGSSEFGPTMDHAMPDEIDLGRPGDNFCAG